jgi:hypothetical protein
VLTGMDKRYFLIIIIICLCAINLYIISNSSDVVGSAYVDVGEYTFSLPNGFTLSSDQGNQVTIINSGSGMHIVIYSSLGENDTFSSKIEDIKKKDDYELYSNGTVNCHGKEIPVAFYHKGSENRSTFYFTEDNNDFRILIIGFNYDSQKNEIIDIVSELVGSVRVNHKLSG